ncbi:MAG TPA: hypothetical protein VEB66_02255 [Opitutaceae bacterium]|nr:hypothetical protein [Opitutaceae bacterium]
MKRLILDEHERGDWYASARGDTRRMSNAKQTFDALRRRGLVADDGKPTLAAIEAAKS